LVDIFIHLNIHPRHPASG